MFFYREKRKETRVSREGERNERHVFLEGEKREGG